MQTEPDWEDRLPGNTTFFFNQEWSFQTCFTVQEKMNNEHTKVQPLIRIDRKPDSVRHVKCLRLFKAQLYLDVYDHTFLKN